MCWTPAQTNRYDLVGFKPQTSVKEGVKNFVEWYKDYYQI
jgi:UDP-glucuronate 4-epimerase